MRKLLDGEEFAFRFDIGLGEPSYKYSMSRKSQLIRQIANHFGVVSISNIHIIIYGILMFTLFL